MGILVAGSYEQLYGWMPEDTTGTAETSVNYLPVLNRPTVNPNLVFVDPTLTTGLPFQRTVDRQASTYRPSMEGIEAACTTTLMTEALFNFFQYGTETGSSPYVYKIPVAGSSTYKTNMTAYTNNSTVGWTLGHFISQAGSAYELSYMAGGLIDRLEFVFNSGEGEDNFVKMSFDVKGHNPAANGLPYGKDVDGTLSTGITSLPTASAPTRLLTSGLYFYLVDASASPLSYTSARIYIEELTLTFQKEITPRYLSTAYPTKYTSNMFNITGSMKFNWETADKIRTKFEANTPQYLVVTNKVSGSPLVPDTPAANGDFDIRLCLMFDRGDEHNDTGGGYYSTANFKALERDATNSPLFTHTSAFTAQLDSTAVWS